MARCQRTPDARLDALDASPGATQVSEITFTDQIRRPAQQVPDEMRAKHPLPKDEQLVEFIAHIKARFERRVAEGKNR